MYRDFLPYLNTVQFAEAHSAFGWQLAQSSFCTATCVRCMTGIVSRAVYSVCESVSTFPCGLSLSVLLVTSLIIFVALCTDVASI